MLSKRISKLIRTLALILRNSNFGRLTIPAGGLVPRAYYQSLFLKMMVGLVLIGMIGGCSVFSKPDLEQSRVKVASKEAVVKEIVVSRADLKRALGHEIKTNKLRAVEVFQNSGGVGVTPSHSNFRLFDIEDGSVYALIGLANADVLVAINERVVVSPQVLGQVVKMMPSVNSVLFEILRGGKSILLKIRITD